ncbi:TIR domain-containing protein [Flavobacterium sp. D11R37]|uniref:toll/interleukin-1 receptor domain-containing protein n=1 Tax=Flavobacterium coralii TaxID=2838017 RepID=UPI001CA654BC|nr:toll/interleukin-1 receptor domain-containing protein [Flavobacterium coralii]MBY8963545.1 TIR domain-containing protein [Flavobacterium coralii]
MRDTIFIGHATPEDNEFTMWLQSKLQNEGYNCECDLSFLLGGEADYWKSLQDILEISTIKYILVISKVTFEKSGVLDEWEHCKTIERQEKLKDFIIPVKIDNSSYSSRIGLNRRNIISFENNWASGLKKLLRKLEYDDVPRQKSNSLSVKDWFDNVYTNWSGIDTGESDVFFSNWIKIPITPSKIFFYKFQNEVQAKAVLKNNIIYPAFRHGNVLVTFQKKLNYYLEDNQFDVYPSQIVSKDTEDIYNRYDSDEFPTFSDFRRLFVRLMRECFERYLSDKDLQFFDLSTSRCYFHEHNPEKKIKGEFIVNDKQKKIGVTGKYYESFWHYAISFKPILFPELCYSLKNHIIFTDDGKSPWSDSKKMHKARRDKGKNMRNKEWRDQQLAFLASLSDNDKGELVILASEDENIVVSTTPILFKADFSYIEPNDKGRVASLDHYIEEEEFYEEENF